MPPQNNRVTFYADEDVFGRATITIPFGYVVEPFAERELYPEIQFVNGYQSSSPQSVPEKIMKIYSILLVGDEPLILNTIGPYLESGGYRVVTAESDREALELLNRSTFDLIITDQVMGKIDGFQVLKRAREVNPKTMVIILTSYKDANYVIDGLGFGVDDYLLKPCKSDEIQFRVERCLEKLEIKNKIMQAEQAAAFGQKAYDLNLDGLFNEAVHLISRMLGTKYAKILEHKPEQGILVLRAGAGWKEGWVGHRSVSDGAGSQGGYTLSREHAVITDDINRESRFSTPSLLTEYGAVCGITVVIPGSQVPFGILGAYHDSPLQFDEHDTHFMESIANILSGAIEQKQAEEQIKDSLNEKVVRLREIHHRAKNNMQVIVSLLRMHSRRINDSRLKEIFNECRDRIYAMSLIHEALYQSEDPARIDFGDYMKKLCRNLNQAYGASRKGIAITVERCNVNLGMDQGIAAGMIISELVANAFKHAFPGGDGGRVSISLTGLDDEDVELIVEDDGIGLPPEIDILKSPSLGLNLAVSAVTRELDGEIKVERDNGTRFIIQFKCNS